MTTKSAVSLAGVNVSRETVARLEAFVALVEKWTPAINLVGRSTLSTIWERHIIDSAQLFALAPAGSRRWLDLGSGGGFPGAVLAIIATELSPGATFTFVESDQRKAAFLRTACQTFGLRAAVENCRIETLAPQEADVITARALAGLSQLCALSKPHLAPNGICLFQKGASHGAEIEDARRTWRMDFDLHPSVTDPEAVILKLKALAHA